MECLQKVGPTKSCIIHCQSNLIFSPSTDWWSSEVSLFTFFLQLPRCRTTLCEQLRKRSTEQITRANSLKKKRQNVSKRSTEQITRANSLNEKRQNVSRLHCTATNPEWYAHWCTIFGNYRDMYTVYIIHNIWFYNKALLLTTAIVDKSCKIHERFPW